MGRRIGKYEILRTLGQGAMGEVYLANHPVIGREVAIKTILPGAATGEDAEGRFRREAEAAGQLNHPNLVTIFDFDKDQEVLFLVMEYVKGDDLEDLIRQRALAPSQFLEILAQVCDGLGHAHRHGIIHRDVKPANVRVVRDGRNLQAKVMDFGIARISDSSMTATGIVMGTVSYMAPEYIREGRATAQSDLFAVGVMLYESLSGRKPFAADNTTTILFKIVSDPPPPIDLEDVHGISGRIHQVLDKALAKDPAQRFQSADDLARALRACKDPTFSGSLDEATALLSRPRPQDSPVQPAVPQAEGTTLLPPAAAAGATTVLPGAQPGLPPAARSRTGLYAAAGVAALLVAGGGGYLLTRSGGAPAAAVPVPAAAAAAPPPAPPAPAAEAPAAPVPAPAAPPAPPLAPVKAAPVAKAKEPAAPAPARAAAPAPVAVVAEAKAPAPAPAAAPAPAPAEDPLKTIGKLIASDPHQAVTVLKPLAQAQPGSVEVQGNYLAALYRTGNAWDFDRALTRATAGGATVKAMLAVPAFRSAMAEESRLQKAKPPAGVLPQDVMARVLEGL